MKPGVVATPLLVQVVTAAGGQCECTRRGCHGQAARCEQETPRVRLIAAPRDVSVAPHAAWRVPVEELAAWCERCYARAWTEAQRARDAAARQAIAADALVWGDVA